MTAYPVAPADVHATLAKHLLTVGHSFVLDLEKSSGPFVRDAKTGQEFLDFASFYASNPLGFAAPTLTEPTFQERLTRAATIKVANPDFYTTYFAEFVETLSRTAAPATHPHYFFVEGGSLAVENAMKVAFDWKVRRNQIEGHGDLGGQILHFEQAFHGRSGYALSVTNTDPAKTLHFPKFPWPRLPNPAMRFPQDDAAQNEVRELERLTLAKAERAFDIHGADIAAILIEPIQGEGGDNHFRPEFLKGLRRLADERGALLIFDEVQTGVGLTGTWWAHQQLDVVPDIICFAKKLQVGGILVSTRVDDVDSVFKVPSRISSTWGGSLVDMVRATRILETIEDEKLLSNATQRGLELQSGLAGLAERFPALVRNVRGRGLMCAIDLPTPEQRTALIKQAFAEHLLLLPSGAQTVRFRPFLNTKSEYVQELLKRLSSVLEKL
ncbi:MAG TPA: L-lysine 6-transaminase [Polyangiaceae bacterium]|nr:L-lysine 6-transaminase [Polyangiaceae bacterium]